MKYYFFFLLIILFLQTSAQNKRISFTPVSFYRSFSSATPPVLKINAGDTVSTESVDAGGFDKTGVKRSPGGNPLTGPFYIENAMPGDVLVISLIKVSLNRPYATTLENFVPRSLPKSLARPAKQAKLVRWNLDLQHGTGTPAVPHEHLQNFKVPLHPFLGCVGVAATGSKKEILSFFNGSHGGNLDFSRITEGATIYLPVFYAGGLLYMGDGHAVQGDGEITGDALETSMDFEFTVKVIKKETLSLSYPRAEDGSHLMAIGPGKSLDKALQTATAGLLEWLQTDYQLSYEEASQVIGPSVEYKIAEIVGDGVIVVAMINKKVLNGLKK